VRSDVAVARNGAVLVAGVVVSSVRARKMELLVEMASGVCLWFAVPGVF
jgi:hypothetical protein